jgi:hypothetical protein
MEAAIGIEPMNEAFAGLAIEFPLDRRGSLKYSAARIPARILLGEVFLASTAFSKFANNS